MVRLHAVTFLAAEGDDLMASEYVFLHLKVLLPGLWKVGKTGGIPQIKRGNKGCRMGNRKKAAILPSQGRELRHTFLAL